MDTEYVKKKRQSYPAELKRQVIKYADQHGNRAAAKQFNLNECSVRQWKAKRASLFKCEQQRRAFRYRKARYPELEKTLAQFVRERRRDALVVTADLIQQKAREIAKNSNIKRKDFKCSRCWVDRFMKRQGFSLRRRTSVCQKLPQAFEHKLTSFQRYVISLRQRGNFLLGQIGNADETPIWLDMPRNYTVNDAGEKQVIVKTTGCEKQRITVMLAATADGRKLPPYIIFKRKTIPKEKGDQRFPPGVVVRAQNKGWMTEDGMCDWLDTIWKNRPGGLLNIESLLVLDAFRGHLTPTVKRKVREMKTELVIIPAGMTSVLQPMDVSINKPFKDNVRKLYENWMRRENAVLTPNGKMKRASPFVVAQWIKTAWDSVSEDVVRRSFLKCSISNALDGSEDDMLWEDEEEPDDPSYSCNTDDNESDSSSHDDSSSDSTNAENEDSDLDSDDD